MAMQNVKSEIAWKHMDVLTLLCMAARPVWANLHTGLCVSPGSPLLIGFQLLHGLVELLLVQERRRVEDHADRLLVLLQARLGHFERLAGVKHEEAPGLKPLRPQPGPDDVVRLSVAPVVVHELLRETGCVQRRKGHPYVFDVRLAVADERVAEGLPLLAPMCTVTAPGSEVLCSYCGIENRTWPNPLAAWVGCKGLALFLNTRDDLERQVHSQSLD